MARGAALCRSVSLRARGFEACPLHLSSVLDNLLVLVELAELER